MDAAQVLRLFPNADLDGFYETSKVNPLNNCYAWAGGDKENIWYPTKSYYLWFTDSKSEKLDNFIDNYGYIGYKEITQSREYEPGFEKLAIFVGEDGLPSHAARQKDNGAWTSKLGILEDVEHKTLECIEGVDYGMVEVILKRPKKDKKEMDTLETLTNSSFEDFKRLVKDIVNVPKKEIDEQLKLEREKRLKNKKRK
jgi:NAD kinase